MARRSSNESTSDLYIRLGLSLDELESGFVDAERTIRDNMARLSRENRIIELQMQVDLSGLDEAADAEQIMQIRTEALNRQIAGQKDRVRLANAELRNMAERHGENSDQAQRARLQLEHERVALARLEEQLRHLGDTQDDANEGATTFLDRISDLAGRFAPYIAAIGSAIAATQELIDKYSELQKQAYELNMPFEKTKELLREIKLGGGDIGDIEGFIRGITDAYVKGEVDDPEFIALSKYGAKITDATGRLKDFKDITEEVYQAYLKAKDAGEEIEFLQLVGGESGVRDAIQFFERYAEAKEDAAKVFDSGVDPKQMQEASRALNLTTEQFLELKDAVLSLITPQVTEGLQNLFKFLREGTQFVAENKDVLTLLSTPTLGPIDLAEKLIGLRAQLLGLPSALKETTVSFSDFKRIINDDVPQKDNNPLSQYAITRIKDMRDELEELRIELDFAGNEYQQAIAKLDMWKKNELKDKLHVSDEERLAIEELYNAKREQLELDFADQRDEIRERIAAADRSDLENKIAEYDKAAQEMISIGMEESEALQLAEKQKLDAIMQLEEEFAAKVDSLHQTSLEKTLAAIEKEKQAFIQKGIDEVRAAEWAEQTKADAQRNAALNALKSQLNELRAFREGGYGGLQEFYKEQLFQQGVRPEELQITPQILQAFEKARDMATKSILPNFMTATERAENAQLEKEWLESYRGKVNAIKGYAIDDDGNIQFLTRGAPHHYPYDKDGNLDKNRAYQLGVDARLEKYFGQEKIKDSLEDLNIGAELKMQLERDLDKLDIPTDDLKEQLQNAFSNVEIPTDQLNQQLQGIEIPVDKLNQQLQGLSIPDNSQPPQPVTNNITNTISITEAHAWDYNHIQELADRVAVIIKPALIDAIGGNANAY